jgi:large subunit ribosomal protein L28
MEPNLVCAYCYLPVKFTFNHNDTEARKALLRQISGVNRMAQVCDICGKGPQFGNKISHAHNVSRRRWNVNLRPVRARVNGANKRVRVCTTCLKSGKVVKASVSSKTA